MVNVNMLLYKQVPTHDVKLSYCEEKLNGIPTPFTLIDYDEWFKERHSWAVSYTGFQQIHLEDQLIKIFGDDKGYAEAHIEYFADYAIAEVIKRYGNEQIVKYVKIGCEHEWEYIGGDRFTTTHRCKKCGTEIERLMGV